VIEGDGIDREMADGDCWVINGRKRFSTNGTVARLTLTPSTEQVARPLRNTAVRP
jgi:alkylation response protein AidB-like acyl-CoA dehydrogenase